MPNPFDDKYISESLNNISSLDKNSLIKQAGRENTIQESVYFIEDVFKYTQIQNENEKNTALEEIKEKYLDIGAPYEINVDDNSRNKINTLLKKSSDHGLIKEQLEALKNEVWDMMTRGCPLIKTMTDMNDSVLPKVNDLFNNKSFSPEAFNATMKDLKEEQKRMVLEIALERAMENIPPFDDTAINNIINSASQLVDPKNAGKFFNNAVEIAIRNQRLSAVIVENVVRQVVAKEETLKTFSMLAGASDEKAGVLKDVEQRYLEKLAAEKELMALVNRIEKTGFYKKEKYSVTSSTDNFTGNKKAKYVTVDALKKGIENIKNNVKTYDKKGLEDALTDLKQLRDNAITAAQTAQKSTFVGKLFDKFNISIKSQVTKDLQATEKEAPKKNIFYRK